MAPKEQNLVLLSADSSALYENYQKTVQTQVDITGWKKKLPKSIRASSRISVWGLNRTKDNEKIWQSLRKRDIALFFREGKYFAKAIILGILQDVEIPSTLWNDELVGKAWHYMIFLDSVKPFNLDFATSIPFFINPTMPNAYVFPIKKVDWERRNLLVRTFGSIEKSLTGLQSLEIPQVEIGKELYSTKIPHEARVELIEALSKKRRGQEQFRKNVLLNYHNLCAVCQIDDEILLQASHIVPVEDQKFSGLLENGICMCALHHIMFDRGYFSINNNYKVIISKKKAFTKGIQGLVNEGKHINKPTVLPSKDLLALHRLRFGFDVSSVGI